MRVLPVVYVTGYALTRGIYRYFNAVVHENMVEIKRSPFPLHFHKPHWYEDEEEARWHVAEMRDRRIAALTKALNKVNNLDPMTLQIRDVTNIG